MQEEKKDLNTKSEVALREEKILEFWRDNKTFEKSLKKDSPKGHYVFYDGPPFATGQIHYGHILGSTAKDAIGRYQTMRGYYVPRKWGWDCHGLPIENIVEKELNIAGHKEIEAYGMDKFVEYARSKVLQYDADWQRGIERIGRWVDFEGGYKTMDNTFIESVWWALSELNKKDLIYEGVRVLAYCARCETPIANSEIAMDNSYKDIPDISIYVKFELENEPGTYMLAWTTTPWTLPGNTAIAINKNINYVKVQVGVDKIILAKDTIPTVLKDKEYQVLEEVNPESLLGQKYKPAFGYYKNSEVGRHENIWKIWHADFVTVEKGTGIAHEAPAFGEDDMVLAKANDIPWIIHVDETGRFKSEVIDFAGMKVKPKDTPEDKDAHLRADIEVIKYLQSQNSYFNKEKIMHSYPHCMRCDTPIIYYALPSWFIDIQKNKKDSMKNAEFMNWIPGHLKEGRFKNIAESAPDWNISRNRYWASPLPIWKCIKCPEKKFISSLEELKKNSIKSGNQYFVMRHGEAENNAKNVYSSDRSKNHLTEKGRAQVMETVKDLKKNKITKIYCSPFLRTRETAELIAEQIGFAKDKIVYDDRIRELEFGDFSERGVAEYWEYMKDKVWEFDKKIPGGESFQDGKNRIGDFLYDVDGQNKGESILIVSHGLAVEIVPAVIEAADKARSLEICHELIKNKTASLHRQHEFVRLPHNKNYELDYHRPYIDEINLACVCGGQMERIPEVLDCWFESGSMPFAQDHFPFENPSWKKNNFPAGFVAEYIGQVRTWFYYTHIVSSLLFNHAPFKNLVTTGTLRAEDGQKMSKSKHNYPDPWIFIDKYGVDALRLYLMSSSLMKGEDTNFSEKSVQDISSKIIGRLFNTLVFYELYRDRGLENANEVPKVTDVLNQWMLFRLNQVLEEVTRAMEMYDMALATRPMEMLVEDLSTWYLRRSRERIKDGDREAKQTLYFVLKNIAKMMAPFAPFAAEDIWQKLKTTGDEESVHLAQWPQVSRGILDILGLRKSHLEVIEKMKLTREIVSFGLEARQKAKLPVRQPLSKLGVKTLDLSEEYLELIKDELNVKEIVENQNIENEVNLDTNITPALKAEGEYREFIRELQERRKKLGLNPSDKMEMTITEIYKKYKLPENLQQHMFRVAAVASVICDNFNGTLDKENIISACLLHDMGNIVKFKLDVFPEFLEPEGLEYWQGVQNEYTSKYGSNDHDASLAVVKEIGVSERIFALTDAPSFIGAPHNAESDDFGMKIVDYSDVRVYPHGVVSIEERFADLRKRYVQHGPDTPERTAFENALREIQGQIFTKCKIKPEDITDASIAPIIEELRGFVIK